MSDSFTWLTEDPTPILIVGGIALAAIIAAVYFTGRAVFLLGAAVILPVLGAVLLVDFMVVTDRERVGDVISAGAAAVEANRLDDLLKLVSPQAKQLQDLARSTLKMVAFTSVRVTSTPKIVINPVTSPKSAEATFMAVAEVKGNITNNAEIKVPRRVRVTFEWQNDRWMVTDARWGSIVDPDSVENDNR